MLDVALHCIRSLLSTASNCTPHERLFNFQRKSASGNSIPTWLAKSKSALLRRHVRGSKYEPLVETVEILDVNPNYAHVRLNNGRETTVSLCHIAPLGDENNYSQPELAATEDPIKSSLDHPPPPSITKDSAINTLADIENYAPKLALFFG